MSAPYWSDDQVTLHLGDCLEVLAGMEEGSVDAIVTDPPYGLEFMGKDWDAPWADADVNADAKIADVGMTSGSFKLGLPTFTGSTNPKCLNCKGTRRGRKDGTAIRAVCTCDEPRFPNTRAIEMHAYQEWCEAWAAECLRVLKPGGHLLAFGGTRTYHRMACAIEDAGFEVRDSIHWYYAQGFPKSLNVSNDVRFCQCDVGELANGHGELRRVREAIPDLPANVAAGEIADLLETVQRTGPRPRVGDSRAQRADGSHPGKLRSSSDAGAEQPGMEGRRDTQAPEGELQGRSLCPLPSGVPADGASGRLHHGAPASDGPMDRPDADADGSREPQGSRSVEQCAIESGVVSDERGSQAGRGWPLCGGCGKPVVPRGLGTALKPAHEPIVVARKPLAGTVAQNVVQHGTGALNVDGCRVGDPGDKRAAGTKTYASSRLAGGTDGAGILQAAPHDGLGRWPSNVVLGPEAAAELDRQSGVLTSGANPSRRGSDKFRDAYGEFTGQTECVAHRGADSGGASRFFPVFRYEAKAAAAERPRIKTTVLRLRADLTEDERAYVMAELRKAGVDAA